MELEAVIKLLIAQMIIVLSLVFIVVFFIRVRKNIEIEKKFSKYTIEPLKKNEISFFDKIFNNVNVCIRKNGVFLSKSKFLLNYSEKYNKHITFEELKTKNGMYILSSKFLLGSAAILLYFIARTIQYRTYSILDIFLSFLVGFLILDVFIFFDYKKKRKQIEEDLLKAVIIMNNTFKSGRSTMQAIEIVKNELDGAISDEFKKIYLDISYGLSLEVVFDRFYERVKLEDAKYIATSLTLLNKTGGNIVKVFENVEREFYNRRKLDNELKTMTASSIFVFRLLLFMPFGLSLIIFVLNKDYFNPLFSNSLGYLILLIIVLLYALYIVLIKKIMRVRL